MAYHLSIAAYSDPGDQFKRHWASTTMTPWCCASGHGAFLGEPLLRVVTDAVDGYPAHTAYQMLAPFSFLDPDGKVWTIPAGAYTNGASIPSLLWSIVGGPMEGPWRYAALVHDQACGTAKSRDDLFAANRMFWHACLAGGCSLWKSDELLAAVNIWAATKFQEPRERLEDQI